MRRRLAASELHGSQSVSVFASPHPAVKQRRGGTNMPARHFFGHLTGQMADAMQSPLAYRRGQPMSVALRKEDLLVDELAELARAYAESQAFVSVLAHELRTRLKVTERSLASEAGREAALENTRSVQELVETLLELARGRAAEPADTGAALRHV